MEICVLGYALKKFMLKGGIYVRHACTINPLNTQPFCYPASISD